MGRGGVGASLRLTGALGVRGGGAGQSVVATDSVSVDADCDNGTMLRSTRGSKLRDRSLDDGVIECLIAMGPHQCKPFIEHSSVVRPNATTGGRFIALVGC